MNRRNLRILDVIPDFYEWPNSWMGSRKDIKSGNDILEVYEPFVDNMILKGLSIKTIKKHIDNLWLLGGEIIRRLNTYEDEESIDMLRYVDESVDSEGGPYTGDIISESEQLSFHATCRKLHKHMKNVI